MRCVLLAFVIFVAGCQGIVGPGGQITGITVPPGCTAQYQVSFGGLTLTGSVMGSCDETGKTAGAAIRIEK